MGSPGDYIGATTVGDAECYRTIIRLNRNRSYTLDIRACLPKRLEDRSEDRLQFLSVCSATSDDPLVLLRKAGSTLRYAVTGEDSLLFAQQMRSKPDAFSRFVGEDIRVAIEVPSHRTSSIIQ